MQSADELFENTDLVMQEQLGGVLRDALCRRENGHQ